MSIFTKANLTPMEYVLKGTLIHLQMRKIPDDKLAALHTSDAANLKLIEDLIDPKQNMQFIFARAESSASVIWSADAPSLSQLSKKALLILKARPESPQEPFVIDENNVAKEIIFMELNKNILDNLNLVCQEIYMTVMSNPLNMIGQSDLVIKDLMSKFNEFNDNTSVTIGQIKGQTILPINDNNSGMNEMTSSKDKAQLYETQIINWTKQIKNVLKQDPENALKNGNNPDPYTEVNFWKSKSENLNSIYNQLNSEKIKKVLKFLEQNKSTFTGPFSKLQKEVQIAKYEANQNYLYLETLINLFSELTDTSKDLKESADAFVPIMHTILLIWNYSEHYNTPARLVVLIKEICNAIIKRCSSYIDGEQIFAYIKNDGSKEALDKLTLVFDICIKFKEAYFIYKAKSQNQWKITSSALFARLDCFSERCQDIMHLVTTYIQFHKHSEKDIGNTKGKKLSEIVKQIIEEFEKTVEELTQVTYDIMNIDNRQFDDDFFVFKQKISELEKRIASVLTQSFDDADTIMGKFKLLDSFEGLLNRSNIQDELERKHIQLLELYKEDLKVVSSIFNEGKALVDRNDSQSPISNNLPPIGGALNWTKGLIERIKEPMDKLTLLSQSMQDREEYKDVQKLYSSLCKNINEYNDLKIKQWMQGVEDNTTDQLNKFLVCREETPLASEGFVRVNFDPILVRLLREVKYLLLLDIKVPETASKLYQKVDTYRTQTGNLEIIVNTYNEILATLLPVEKPLLADKIEKMNKNLEPGISQLKWNSEKIDPFINQAMNIVNEVDALVKHMKENVHKMQIMMKKWQVPLFERRMRTLPPEELDSTHASLVGPRLEDIKNHGRDIHKLMKETADYLKPDKKSQNWIAYVDYVNGLVIQGITEGIDASLKFLSDQISIPYNKHHGHPPMFLCSVNLQDREVIFEPTIECNSRQTGIQDILQKIIDDFISISVQMNRLDTNSGDYLVEIKDQFQLFGTMQGITDNIHEIREATANFIAQYNDKEFLWKETLEESFQKFLNTGEDPREIKHTKINDDGEEEEDETFDWMAKKILNGVQTRKPDLDSFDQQITYLNSVKNEISDMHSIEDIGWLKINASPFIKTLQITVNQWIDTYTSFLMDNTVKEIQNIEKFISDVTEGIEVLPTSTKTEREKDLLKTVMYHLRDVKMIQQRTLDEIEPMKQNIALLKRKQISMDTDYLVKLENCKTALTEVSERALRDVKEAILPLQTQEAGNIKDRLRKFAITVGEYRMEFQNSCPYHVTQSSAEIIQTSYDTIETYLKKTIDLETEASQLNDLETLFDLQKSTYKQLKDCRYELLQIKQMWDMISLVDFQFDAWKTTKWDAIDTDLLMQIIKDIQTKQCAPTLPQNKDIKNWRSFQALCDRVKNMNTILPLIALLHSKFMQDRHWRKLMGITGKSIDHKSPNFCLQDLIQLELYKYAEDVTELVDGAQKESKIETKLQNIQKVWQDQKFEFVDYKDAPILAVSSLDEIMEFVETHLMELMGMMSSKDVEEFKDKVTLWQQNLRTIDQVIAVWFKVQKNWQKLEPIFLASEDIRAQLHDETKRFEFIHVSFQDLMREAKDDPGVVNACTYEGREELLKNFADEIEMCEKALDQYLGQKKKMFARFYFVSDQALLEILSNSNNPEKVDEYIGDCFDGMKRLEFVRGPGIPYPSKRATSLISKDTGEQVYFYKEFQAVGPVESYLTDLEKLMRDSLKHILDKAKQTAEGWELGEKVRHIWLDDYCAQISLLATQIQWTEETTRAFDEIEGGSETAMKENYATILNRIKHLITRVRQPLTNDQRVKIITIITVDVHARDVVEDFVNKKIQDQGMFAWQSQLKFYMELRNPKDEQKTCNVKICDWLTYYNYEYVGNCGRLVITPLTDRCYITLTQALNLTMGGAPAGPAGTGKTETTKDLGRALGLHVVVFNCSDQMNYSSMALIFMGLSQTGAWGCFDEFNRIKIEVLSVISNQVKTVQDALLEMKANPAKNVFSFMEEEIGLKITVGFFITMNPGYAGRTELPENLKALFRSCAMVVPDITRICENMLMSEGFATAKPLSQKFMTLYNLSKSLLSAQIHYDWGLRAVKSVLRQAGGLKRNEPDVSEDIILYRGLRDFNLPKIVVEDRQIFKDLIKCLFPGLDPPKQVDDDLVNRIIETSKKMGYKPEDDFVLKCADLADILVVRHSVFIIGNPGTAKTTITSVLSGALTMGGMDTISEIVDPKAVTSDELYGCMNQKTKEWKDGILSTIMRDMNKNNGPYKAHHKMKWVILDGDVDPEWIETMNTVMDDNKVLTLVSSERIPLTPEMRLIIEVSNLSQASPATVSRGGVLFINDNDVGWKPYFDSWLVKYKKIQNGLPENVFTLCLTNYLNDTFIEDLKNKTKIAPVCDMSQVHSLTCIIDRLNDQLHQTKAQIDHIKKLHEENKEDDIKTIYEAFFIFALMWAYGGALEEDKISFSGIIKGLAGSNVPFPQQVNGQCFDFFFDPIQLQWTHWDTKVVPFNKDYEGLFINLVVPTADTTRQIFLLNMHVASKKGMLYVGSAGTGKTTVIKDFFSTLDKEQTLFSSQSFNNYTDSKAVQIVVESQCVKRTRNSYGPPLPKTMIYFLDDLNMPKVDKYLTQQPISLIRQIIDYGIVYDRDHLEEKKFLVDVMFTACMNPKSGSFYVDLRLSRHFTTISCLTADREILRTIYLQILDNHLSTFDKGVSDMASQIVEATMGVFLKIANSPQFMPTARKFHYQFNLRDFARIIQNMMLAQPGHYKGKKLDIARLWAHECHRIWGDRLIFKEDQDQYMGFMKAEAKAFGDIKEDDIFAEPNIYTSFIAACEGHEPAYLPIRDIEQLRDILERKLDEYCENVASMPLVLFNQAMEHISRICRIIDLPVGSALLVGVGGSGKQSLSKLASFILGYDIFRIVVTTSYKLVDLKLDIQTMFTKTGVAGTQLLFILTDAQIPDNKFLVPINDLLSAGWISELFPKDELDGLLGKIRSEAKSNGVQDTPDELFEFFLDKVRKNLHIALCFSPNGDALRFRARMFPGLINCTQLDWFHEWPRDALIGVADRFLKEVELPSEEIRDALSANMAQVHLSIAEANGEFLKQERRYNYTTPTSYLELINFYKLLLGEKRGKITEQINRLEIGLQTMKSTTEQVEGLQELLKVKMVDVGEERTKTNALIEYVGREQGDAEIEADAAAVQAKETEEITNQANETKANADKSLESAIPKMKAAEAAVNCLKKDNIQILKNLGTPPDRCVDVAYCCQILLNNEKKYTPWPKSQQMMKDPQKFLDRVVGFDKNSIDEWKLNSLQPYLDLEWFNQETMMKSSEAAAYLCSWIVNVVEYFRVYTNVKPLQEAAAAAQLLAEQKTAELKIVLEKVRVINEKVDDLKKQLAEAQDNKQRVEDEAQALQDQLDLANRLVNGLADENKRWGDNVVTYKSERVTMIGDSLVSAAFVSYIAPFSFKFRNTLWQDQWIPDIIERKIPITEGIDPLDVLSTASDQAIWKSQGLPADRISLENASITVSCSRYALLIDPQFQGLKWIRGKEGQAMVSIQLSQKFWLKKVEQAVQNGNVLMIEAIGEEIDAILDPLLSRQFIKKGKNQFVKLGSEDVEISPKFQLYLQTKLSNPHYKPETAAQCTIINFIVTENGLEDQLLASVVKVEKPDLEQSKEELVAQQNQYQITLAQLETDLLKQLSDADPATILQNKELIVSLEDTKKTSNEIQEQQAIAKVTEVRINTLREIYRPVASEGAMLYFLLIQLYVIAPMYQYSLESFQTFFFKAIEKTEQFEEEEQRCLALREMIRMTIYQWVSRGLFVRHKQIFRTQLTFRLMQKKIINVDYTEKEMKFLLSCPLKNDAVNPLKDWLPDIAWFAMNKLVEIEGFENFITDVTVTVQNNFKTWYNELNPEDFKLPLDWKKLDNTFQKLLPIRVLRPDRVTTALDNFIRKTLPNGNNYVDCDDGFSQFQILHSSYIDSTTTTPIYFILSPGADPVKDVEQLGRQQSINLQTQFHQVALGQGQDVVAKQKLEIAHREGHWVMLQNVHLMPDFLIDLEKILDAYALEGSSPQFRLFISSDPSNAIPIGLLQRSIKLTNEPPMGVKQNMKRAFGFFSKEYIEEKDPKIRTILFGLCFFHTVMLERRQFGPKGWNMRYPFSAGDLRDSSLVLNNYMETNAQTGKIPWDDLKYIFGEIMYGGHIIDNWDRILCGAYLDYLMKDELIDELELFPYVEGKGISFKCPQPTTHDKYVEYIDTECPPETPLAFGMHPNAEIDFRTNQCVDLFKQLMEITPKDAGSSEEGGMSLQDIVVAFSQKVYDECALDQGKINMEELVNKIGDTRDPYQNAFMQECEYVNAIIRVVIKSLEDLALAFKGELTMSESMETLMQSIFLNNVPAPWMKISFLSVRGLASWVDNLKARLDQLNIWKEDPSKMPTVTFVNRLHNPQSFLTAIKQVFAMRPGDEQELDKLTIFTHVEKKMYWETDLPPLKDKEGAYVFGFQVEGARWDASVGQLDESLPKRAFSVMPVIKCIPQLIPAPGKEEKNIYQCPVYKTENRGATYVFTATLKTKYPVPKWVLAGVAIILDVEGVSDVFAPGKEIPLA